MEDIYFVSCLISGFQKMQGQMLERTLCVCTDNLGFCHWF